MNWTVLALNEVVLEFATLLPMTFSQVWLAESPLTPVYKAPVSAMSFAALLAVQDDLVVPQEPVAALIVETLLRANCDPFCS